MTPVFLILSAALMQAPAPAPSPAKPLDISGPDKVLPYKLVRLAPVNADPGATVVWDVYPDDNIDIDERSDNILAFTGPPGVYKIKCRTVVGKTVQLARKTVTIGTPAPPDALSETLKQAFQSESPDDQQKVSELAAIYRNGVVNGIPVAQTIKALTDAMHASVQAGIGNSLPKVRRVLGDELNRQIVAPSTTPLDASLRATYAAQFNRFATLLEGLQ